MPKESVNENQISAITIEPEYYHELESNCYWYSGYMALSRNDIGEGIRYLSIEKQFLK